MSDRIFSQHRLPQQFISNLLFKIYRGALLALQNNDEEFIREYLEEEFANKLWATSQNLQKNGYKVITPLLRMMFLDWSIWRRCRTSRHTCHTSVHNHRYVDDSRTANQSEAKRNVERLPQMGRYRWDGSSSIHASGSYRSTKLCRKEERRWNVGTGEACSFKMLGSNWLPNETPCEDTIRTNPRGDRRYFIHPSGSLWNRDESTSRLQEYQQDGELPGMVPSLVLTLNVRLGKFKFGAWKLVDVDNWMKGNPIFLDSQTKARYDDPVFKLSKLDREFQIDLRSF